MLAAGRPMIPRSVGAVAAAPWHSSHTESKSSAPALASPEGPVSAVLAVLAGDWARAFQATALAEIKIAASRKTVCCLSVNIRFVPVIAEPSSRDQVYAQTDDPS